MKLYRTTDPKLSGSELEPAGGFVSSLRRIGTTVDVSRARSEDWAAISRMLELYQHDLSNLWDQDLNERGEYGYDVTRYADDPCCLAFVFRVAGRYAGFALVDPSVRLPQDEWWLAQFFVIRKYRLQGVGRLAAHAVFDRVRGRWEVGQMAGNHAAQAFWRGVIAGYTQGRFVEHGLDDRRWVGLLQCFDNTAGDTQQGLSTLSAKERP